MPLVIERNDITQMAVDAIVNTAKNTRLSGGGVAKTIHKAAGPGLLAECRAMGRCARGRAKITQAYDLPCKYVIHTVAPLWMGGSAGERILRSCYRESLTLAKDYGCQTVAFPLIGTGRSNGMALRVAVDTISGFLLENDDMTVRLVVYGDTSLEEGSELFADVAEYIDDNYDASDQTARRHPPEMSSPVRDTSAFLASEEMREGYSCGEMDSKQEYDRCSAGAFVDDEPTGKLLSPKPMEKARYAAMGVIPLDLDDALKQMLMQMDESFTQMLLRKIDEKGMTDVECYKKANIDRKLFSKIRSDIHYKPRKSTVLALAIALELPLAETRDMLAKAGFALSHSSQFDIIVEYFIQKGNFNIFEINEVLFLFDQRLLGA